MILPLVFVTACMLAILGWRRGAVAWLAVIGVTFGVVLALKLAFVACGPPELRTPSGHAAAAGIVCGGFAVILSRGRGRASVLLAALFGATVIGLSRLLLHVHTAPEVALGGGVGVVGALALARFAGPPPPRFKLVWLIAAAIAVVLILHGARWDAEPLIDHAAMRGAAWFGVCRGEPPLLGPAHRHILRHPFEL